MLTRLNAALSRNRVVVLVGPRQSGKTTLARELLEEDSVNYFDLEDPASIVRLWLSIGSQQLQGRIL